MSALKLSSNDMIPRDVSYCLRGALVSRWSRFLFEGCEMSRERGYTAYFELGDKSLYRHISLFFVRNNTRRTTLSWRWLVGVLGKYQEEMFCKADSKNKREKSLPHNTNIGTSAKNSDFVMQCSKKFIEKALLLLAPLSPVPR